MSPMRISPEVGRSSLSTTSPSVAATIILKRVVLPTPLGPMTPTIPLRGSVNERSSSRSRSPKPLVSPFASTTKLPRRGPGGIWISSMSNLRVLSAAAAISSYRSRRARLLVCRAFAFERTHSSSSVKRFCNLTSFWPSIFSRVDLVSR